MSYQNINLSANLNLIWPGLFNNGTPLCSKNDVTPTANGFNIVLPNAPDGTLGAGGIFNNLSTYSFSLVAYGQSTPLYTVVAGGVVEVYLADNTTNLSGAWRVIPYGGGSSNISSLNLSSSDSSVAITNGSVSAPGGSVDFKLPSSISNLTTQILETGIAVVSSLNPLGWKSVNLVAGENISINNPNAVASDPVISLSPTISAINSIQVGGITISGEIIDANALNGDVSISSNGTGKVHLNGVGVDANANITGVNNLSLTGRFLSAYTPAAWVNFTDTIVTGSNQISVTNNAGISTVTGSAGNYIITFSNPMPNISYAVFITPSSTDAATPLVTQGFPILQTLTSLTIVVVDAGGEKVSSIPNGISVLIMST